MKQTKPPKVLDTFLRALERLADIAPEVDALEEELEKRELEILARVLELLKPILPRLAGPIVLREPWLEDAERPSAPVAERRWPEDGLVLAKKFQQDRSPDDDRLRTYRSSEVVIDAHGKLTEIEQTARWREGPAAQRDAVWRIESRAVAPDERFARENLRRILATLLDVMRERLKREVDRRGDTLDRIALIEEAARVLEKRPGD